MLARALLCAQVQFRDPYKFKTQTETFIAAEGMYTGQFVYCGKNGMYKARSVLARWVPEMYAVWRRVQLGAAGRRACPCAGTHRTVARGVCF